MKINVHRKPFNHIIIDDYFSPEEYYLIWNEIMFLVPKMMPPNGTGAATHIQTGIPIKKGIGIFVDRVYTQRSYSDILNITRKLFTQEIVQVTEGLDLYFKQFKNITTDSTLVQLYSNGDYYKAHTDKTIFSAVTVLHRTPKSYTGGELRFPEYDHSVDLTNNQLILFPSLLLHEVCEVKVQSNDAIDGRISISQLISTYEDPNRIN